MKRNIVNTANIQLKVYEKYYKIKLSQDNCDSYREAILIAGRRGEKILVQILGQTSDIPQKG